MILFEASHHQRSHRRIELENPEHQIRRARLSQLQIPSDSHSILLRKAGSLPIMNLHGTIFYKGWRRARIAATILP
jgi:hypothetical protein